MSAFIVEGQQRLEGEIRTNGNKNEALPVIAAALLSQAPIVLRNVPDIADIRSMLAIAKQLGATVGPLKNGTVTLQAETIGEPCLPPDRSSAIRGSILFASSLLARTGLATVPQPGGDTIGRRRLDTHFHVFQALGAKVTVERTEDDQMTQYHLSAPKGLKGTEIYLDEASVTATENALIAACGAKGTTVIANAASEPHVQGLCHLLCAMDAHIDGVGSNILTVTSSRTYTGATHRLGSDYIEAGSLIGCAAATGSELIIRDVDIQHMRMILFQFERLGIKTRALKGESAIVVPGRQNLRMKSDLGGAIPKIEDSPWPAFPADLTSIMVVVATQCKGTCLIHEKMFESRLFFVDTLIDMGARIVLCDPHRAVIVGPSRLYARTISSPNIRAGMALLIAALAAEGTSIIHNVVQIDRGYEHIDRRLNALGARIRRIDERRKSSVTAGS